MNVENSFSGANVNEQKSLLQLMLILLRSQNSNKQGSK
jgi:hypothetical protein